MDLTLRFAHMWWAGFKAFCRWCAFGIVLWILSLPIMGFAYLIGYFAGNYVGSIFSTVFLVLVVPVVFYLISRHLLLLTDKERAVEGATGNPATVSGRRDHGLRSKILWSMAIAYSSAFFFGPPDLISQFVFGIPAALLCGLSLLILSRFNFMKSSSKSVHTLVCVLVCLISVLFITCSLFVMQRIADQGHRLAGSSQSSGGIHYGRAEKQSRSTTSPPQ